jgi:hypothetical protein
MNNHEDFLEPEEPVFWTLPIIRRNFNKVADALIPDVFTIRLAMLCLPSFEPEWIVSLQHRHKPKDEYFMCVREATEQIRMSETPAAEILTRTEETPVESDFADALFRVWRMMLSNTKVPPPMGRFDGIQYRFMCWDKNQLTGKTHSPAKNSNAGQLVAIGELLRDVVLAQEAQRQPIQQTVFDHIVELEERLKSP